MKSQFNGERLKKARIYRGLTVAELAGIFHSAFKTNLYLDRAVLTGITRVRTPAATVWQEN